MECHCTNCERVFESDELTTLCDPCKRSAIRPNLAEYEEEFDKGPWD